MGRVILRHTFIPLNNTRLQHLCGPMDEHLRTIEAGLQVAIAHRHEQFKVDGPKKQAERAMPTRRRTPERFCSCFHSCQRNRGLRQTPV